jgi:hypothetical protein
VSYDVRVRVSHRVLNGLCIETFVQTIYNILGNGGSLTPSDIRFDSFMDHYERRRFMSTLWIRKGKRSER